jgi:hypothetical protein
MKSNLTTIDGDADFNALMAAFEAITGRKPTQSELIEAKKEFDRSRDRGDESDSDEEE